MVRQHWLQERPRHRKHLVATSSLIQRVSAAWKGLQHASVRCTLVGIVTVGLVACAAPGDIDDTDSPTILVIESIEPLTDPFGDVISDAGTVQEDVVRVTFSAHPKSLAVTGSVGPEFLDVIVERYEVTFERTDGGTAVPKGFQRAMTLRVENTPHGVLTTRTTFVDIVLVPSTIKTQPPISFLISPGFEPDTGFVNIQVDATIRFFGRTLGGHRVSATGSIGIDFADFAG